MPVVSKPFRAKNGPPILGPIPYRAPRQAWSPATTPTSTPDSPALNGEISDANIHTPARPNVLPLSILRKPGETTGGTTPKTPTTVTFSNDNNYENAPPRLPKRPKVAKPPVIEEQNQGESNVALAAKPATKPKRTGLVGVQAVKECEEHTDWANAILAGHNLPLVSNLTTSISDGFTLPAILEIISGVSLTCVQASPKTKEDRVRNIRNCLKFLCRRGVDITEIEPTDIEDGNLKSILVLVGNIRKHFKTSYTPEQNGHGGDVANSPLSGAPDKGHNMPGAIKIPGAVPTPFLPHRDQASRNAPPETPARSSAFQEVEMLPGMLGMEHGNNNKNNTDHGSIKPHSNIISTTEIGMNGVSQHGVDERKTHFANNNNGNIGNNRSMVIRHPNAKGLNQNIQENSGMPPSAAQRAWTESPNRVHGNNVNGIVTGPSVEDRLRQLITSNNRQQPGTSAPQGRDKMAYPGVSGGGGGGGGGFFHCGGSEVFDLDGEVLVVPPPKARNSGADTEDNVFGDNSYGPGYRHLTNQHERQRSQPGYVPSKPTEKRQGSRADVIISRPPSAIAFRHKKQPGPQVASYVDRNRPNSAAGNLMAGSSYSGGKENGGFVHDNGPLSADFTGRGNQPAGNVNINGPIGKKAPSNDLRNAWNKLYGPQGQVPPHVSPTMRRGNNFRSSYGPQSPQREAQNGGQNVDKFSRQQTTPLTSRPVSAPAPADMQAFFNSHERLQGTGQAPSHDELDGQGRTGYSGQVRYGPSQGHSGQGHLGHDQGHLGQGHGHPNTLRESPMGQSSSTQGHLDESSSSQQSRLSQEMMPKKLHVQTAGDNSRKLSQSSPSSLSQPSPSSPGSPNYAIGPETKYPDNPSSRPTSARKPDNHRPPALPARSPQTRRPTLPQRHVPNSENVMKSDKNVSFTDFSVGINNNSNNTNVQKNNNINNMVNSQDLTTALQAASREHRFKFDTSHDLSHNQSHDISQEFPNRSIFDYQDPSHSESTGSVTPPLPPLSPTNTPPDSPRLDPTGNLTRSISATNVSSGDMALDDLGQLRDKRKPRRTSELNFRMAPRPHSKKSRRGFKKGANLNNVRESDSESDMSFDIHDTILTVESHDTAQNHPAGDIFSSREATFLRQQLHDLEYKYNDLQNKVHPGGHGSNPLLGPGKGPGLGPPPIGRQRRWSIGSSDTSSFRRDSKFKPGKQAHHKYHSKEFKNINKRFQRLESHVVTLARSVAHLSSELRTHNTMVNDLESVKLQLQELRENPSRPFPNMLGSHMTEQQRIRDWVPGLTNPKRVNKLTKFFGEEPPLLNFFLKKLGYERYVPNFQSEHIGMIELPYMTEDRLEKIGVPMGPRLRILQEAQLCFRQENFDIYLV